MNRDNTRGHRGVFPAATLKPNSGPADRPLTSARSIANKPRQNFQPPPDWTTETWDVIVIGGGNAAVVSALTASDLGARVLLLERAPQHMRGGNSRHTRNIRCVHNESDDFCSGAYTFDELWNDLCNVGTGPSNEELAHLTVARSECAPSWMYGHGARWQRPLSGTLQLGRTNRFFLGGGKALINSYYREVATRPGIVPVFDAYVDELEFVDDRCCSITVAVADQRHRLESKAVICASGGFEANLEWLRCYWGDAVDNYIIRGTPYNEGNVLECLFQAGAARAGQERGFHAIALDARAPKFDGGIATRLDMIPLGIAVDRDARRFYDEGEDLWPKRYATWGMRIATQPDQIATVIWDSKVNRLFLPPMYPAVRADSIRDLAVALELDPGALEQTVREFNGAIQPGGTFDRARLDGCHTAGIMPPKSHWAQPINEPPFFGIALRPGITFTYMGVAVNRDAQVLRDDGRPFANVFAAGEIMSGNILSTGYLAGFGMTIGTVWGRLAGASAAQLAQLRRDL